MVLIREAKDWQLYLVIFLSVKNGGTLSASIISGSSELSSTQVPTNVVMGNVNYASTASACGSCDGTGIIYNYMNGATCFISIQL